MNEVNKRPEIVFTDAQRLAAARSALSRNVLVLDLGPSELPPPSPDATPEEIEAAKAAKRAHDDWQAKNKEPVQVEMHNVDANHAVSVDPARYVIIPPAARAPLTLEERVAFIERRLGPETPEEIDRRIKRDADAAAKVQADAEAKAAETAPTPGKVFPAREPAPTSQHSGNL